MSNKKRFVVYLDGFKPLTRKQMKIMESIECGGELITFWIMNTIEGQSTVEITPKNKCDKCNGSLKEGYFFAPAPGIKKNTYCNTCVVKILRQYSTAEQLL